jgi:hypothetical protein
MPDELSVSTTLPSECSSAELAEISSLVRSGGEVMEAGVELRISEAKALFSFAMAKVSCSCGAQESKTLLPRIGV